MFIILSLREGESLDGVYRALKDTEGEIIFFPTLEMAITQIEVDDEELIAPRVIKVANAYWYPYMDKWIKGEIAQ